jgi:hypothetical protein
MDTIVSLIEREVSTLLIMKDPFTVDCLERAYDKAKIPPIKKEANDSDLVKG